MKMRSVFTPELFLGKMRLFRFNMGKLNFRKVFNALTRSSLPPDHPLPLKLTSFMLPAPSRLT
jgi:hypothetical protein